MLCTMIRRRALSSDRTTFDEKVSLLLDVKIHFVVQAFLFERGSQLVTPRID